MCEENHGSLCFSQILDDQGPRLLIDVVHHCLMESSLGCRYVALSYVWGQVSMLQALKSNLGQLQEGGTLKVLNNKISSTITDAMEIVAGLGERYLWGRCLMYCAGPGQPMTSWYISLG